MDITKEELTELIRACIAETLKDYEHSCRFKDKEVKDVSRYVNVITRMGNGDFDDGLELVKENHKFLKEMRNKGISFQNAIFMVLATGVGGALIAMLWEGFRLRVLGGK